MKTWTLQRQDDLRELLRLGLTCRRAALVLGVARGSVCWASRRYGLRPGSEPVPEGTATGRRLEDWDEARLTERWADRKRRAA